MKTSQAKSAKSFPVYATKSIIALALLFRPYNDMDIYVEDATCRNMYEVLVNRILQGRAKVRRIFQLGGLEQVVDACRADQTESVRKRLYIIDGDFNALFGRQHAPELKYLYQLKVYSSENLLFCENAAMEVACECLTNTPRNEIETIVDFNAFVSDVVVALKELLLLYAAIFDLNSSLKTMGFSVNQLVEQSGNYTKISPTRVGQRIAYLRSELSKTHSQEVVEEAMMDIEKLIPNDNCKICRYISGKTYLLPLLHFHFRAKAGLASKLDQLKVRLARHCDLDIDAGLSIAIKAAAKS